MGFVAAKDHQWMAQSPLWTEIWQVTGVLLRGFAYQTNRACTRLNACQPALYLNPSIFGVVLRALQAR